MNSTVVALIILLIASYYSLPPKAIGLSWAESASVQSIKLLGNISGDNISQLQIGQQAIVRVDLVNNLDSVQPFAVIAEVRAGSGIAEYIAWQSGRLAIGGNYTFQTTWMPDRVCTESPECNSGYQIRAFVLTGLDNPQVLSPVEVLQGISVIERTEQGNKLYRLDFDGKEHVIEFSLGSGNIKQIIASAGSGAMVLHLERVTSDTELSLRLSNDLMDAIFLEWAYPLPSGEKPDYTAEVVVDTLFVEPISVQKTVDYITWVIPIQTGSEEVELVVGGPI